MLLRNFILGQGRFERYNMQKGYTRITPSSYRANRGGARFNMHLANSSKGTFLNSMYSLVLYIFIFTCEVFDIIYMMCGYDV